MGEGKSAGLCWAIFYHTKHNPGARWALIRDTWENLQATTQKEFFKWFPPGIFGEYLASAKTFRWTVEGMGGGEVQFLGMDDPSDASKLQSRELAGFAIDEPAPAAESGGVSELIFDIALSRLRQPGMNWYSAKLAQNNSDETHWTYRRFVAETTPGFRSWQTAAPENESNLPPGYYETLRQQWAHRPDIVRRFVEGKFGYQQQGKSVTPEWSDDIHLATGLVPVRGVPLHLLWDFGLNPTCIITQVTPLGHWLALDAFVGDGIGTYELIDSVVKPTLTERYRRFTWDHIGDPAGTNKEQSTSKQSAVRVIRKELGGTWRSGVKSLERIEPLRAVLRQTRGGGGLLQVDRSRARAVWQALRGGWHYHVARNGLTTRDPLKNEHSHPGDAMSYGASLLFPLGALKKKAGVRNIKSATFFQSGLGFERPDLQLPRDARKFGQVTQQGSRNV